MIGNDIFPFDNEAEKYSINTTGFEDFKITNKHFGSENAGHYGMVNPTTKENYKYHLWFVPSDDLMSHVAMPSMEGFLEKIFPSKEQTWNDDRLTIVIDRRTEAMNNGFANIINEQFEELGYNSKRIKWLSCSKHDPKPNITVYFPWELFMRTMRFQLNDENFGSYCWGRDAGMNSDYTGHGDDYRDWLLDLDSPKLLEKRPYTFLNYKYAYIFSRPIFQTSFILYKNNKIKKSKT